MESLTEYQHSQKHICMICGEISDSYIKCDRGHFVCDRCDNLDAADFIETFCAFTPTEDPMQTAQIALRHPKIGFNTLLHHFLTAAVLLSSYYNKKKRFDIKRKKIHEARLLLDKVNFCASPTYGICGSAVACGVFLSLIIGETPVAVKSWEMTNRITAQAQLALVELGSPRCCKRDMFLSLLEALHFLRDYLDIIITHTGIECEFHANFKDCPGNKCPFFKVEMGAKKLI
jgi:hypothetical protein